MAWIKRNLFFVVGGVITLALLGVAGFFLYTKIQEETQVTTELDSATAQLQSLVNRDPAAKENNIEAAKSDYKKLTEFVAELRKDFEAPAYPAQLNNREFRELLENTMADLRRSAEKAGVKIPETNYWFTFNAQKTTMNLPDASLEPLASQLADISAIVDVLFKAKVNSIEMLKRAPLTPSDNSGGTGQDYHGAKPATNDWAVVMPYEVSFFGFSSELADVLEGFIRSRECLVVKNVVIEAAPDPSNAGMAAVPAYNPMPGAPSGMDPALAARYGIGGGMASRYGLGRGASAAPAPRAVVAVPRPGSNNILEEKMLRVTLSLEAIKVKPAAASASAGTNQQ